MTTAEIRQAAAVAIGGKALLIEGPPGCGKTTLALSLLDRGASLIGDDGVALTTNDGALIASPPPNTSGLIEVRGVGLIERPSIIAPVSLILAITPDAPRYIERADTIAILGHDIPIIQFARYNEADPIRAEAALDLHGLAATAHKGN
ncbi:HPr kinase/phosphatase C-terminal domain-containing protein [Pontixanthobacter aestiaquae]|uniref:Serine kinase n=1 Tax=Pontixanthobacter aestiaquae TaxID=1509367 RepID=A0A844Z7J0_9SPHN|nr:HPr kinase/phosphatase C-terminal domain-containing protein [Pontixanthobacter aestiaquae]MDN3645960.1 HPr kinase/phosphatase C-terminal domain-containing protein [Pontixanthobacter aestiaquae]MXO83047.1 serine kinase [Pontixanthobacter aestiaquae]